MASITQRLLVLVFTVFARNAWHNNAHLCIKYDEKPRGGGSSRKIGWGSAARSRLKPLCNFPYPISDLIKNLIPYFRHEALEPGAWPAHVTSCYGTYTVGVNITVHQRHLWNYRTYTTTLQYTCCTQTGNDFTSDDYLLMSRTKTNRRTDREQYTRSNATCIGETGRNFSTRLTEHKRATRNGDVNNHIAEHHLQTKHQMDWDSATCITYSTDYYQRLTLDSWFTNLEQTPPNRSQQLPAPCKRLIDEIKQN